MLPRDSTVIHHSFLHYLFIHSFYTNVLLSWEVGDLGAAISCGVMVC
jgi:hypothetical protein